MRTPTSRALDADRARGLAGSAGPPSAAGLIARVRAITLLAVVAMSSLHGAIAVMLLMEGSTSAGDPMAAAAAAITTPLLAAGVARRALASRDPSLACVGLAILAGVLNLPAALVICVLSVARPDVSVQALAVAPLIALVCTVLGGVVSAPLGLAFGLALRPLIAHAARSIAEPDHGMVARTMVAAGTWTLGCGALAVVLCLGRDEALAGALAMVGGAIVACWGLSERARDRALAVRARRGELAGFSLVDRSAVDTAGLLPLAPGMGFDRVLVREIPIAEDAPYRGAVLRVPCALIASASSDDDGDPVGDRDG
jgi:hypothetical protein